MPQSFSCVHCHIIFSTKLRRPVITSELQPQLFEYIGGILRNNSSSLVAAGGVADHVHLLVSIDRTLAIADAVRLIKTNSSEWIHDDLGISDFGWQNGYGAFAVSYSNIDQVKAYLSEQEHHHRTSSFQDEFRDFLRRHNLEWDERYVWD